MSQNIQPEWAVIAINHQLHVLIGKAHGGVGLRHVTKGVVQALHISLPSLAEQKRIATILNERIVAVEKARAAAEAQIDAARRLPAAYLRAVFNGPEAQQWLRKRLGDECSLLPSRSISTDGDTVVRAITTACLTESGFSSAGIKDARMFSRDAKESAISSGEVLVARSNTPELVGRVSMYDGSVEGQVVASDLTIRLWPSDRLISDFLASYLSWLYMSGYWREHAGGASGTMKKITRQQLAGLEIPTPPRSVQEKITKMIRSSLEQVKHVRLIIEHELRAINTLPVALLRQAFSGNL